MIPDPTLYTELDSPVGRLLLARHRAGLTGIYFQTGPHPQALDPAWQPAPQAFDDVITQLKNYFAGDLTEFALPLDPGGTPFQLQVWRALQQIPYGETVSYGDLAARIGRPTAVRAVGAANGRNPLPIVIPCHRVIGRDGSLTGYGGGLAIKEALLEMERSRGVK